MDYNFDKSSKLLDVLGMKSPQKFISIGQRVALKHYSMFDFTYAFVMEVDEQYVKLKFRSSFPELDFFPEDPVVISLLDNDKIYIASCEIVSIISYDPLAIDIKVHKLEKKETMRKHERFYVSLAATIISPEYNEPTFAIVKNLSFSGFKVNSKKSFEENSQVELILNTDIYISISLIGTIVRKNRLGLYYEYGIEITDISKSNMLTFQHYINQLKSGSTL
jgi:hypothetical protein